MKWDKVEIKTEQVVDENPETWIKSATADGVAGNYGSALNKLQHARKFAKDNPKIIAWTYGLEVEFYFYQGNISAARKSSQLFREYGSSEQAPSDISFFQSVVNTNPVLIYMCMTVNSYDDIWYKTWLDSIKHALNDRNYNAIEELLSNDKTIFTNEDLAECANNKFVFGVVQDSKTNLLQALYKGGFNLSACKFSDTKRNLTMVAVIYKSSTDTLKFLLDNRINDIDDKDKDGWTALMHCENSDRVYNEKHSTNFELLINAGANVNTTNQRGQTVLMIAAQHNNTEAVRLLLDSGANISLRDSDSCDAIFYATDNRTVTIDCLRSLIKHGANVNQRYTHVKNKTLLMVAAQHDNVEAIRLLLDSGANISLRDSDNCDAIFYTTEEKCLKLLTQNGADINQHYTQKNGKTLLHIIATQAHWKNIPYWKTLLDLGADVNAKDNDGITPLEYALDHSWTFTAELDLPRALVKKGATVNYRVKEILRQHSIKEAKLYNNSTNFFFSSWFN